MSTEAMGGLEDLMMGSPSEGASESNEQFQARLAAAQARMAKIAKDEKKAKNFDAHLAKLIPACSQKGLLDMVILMINHDIPSLTIIASLTLVMPEAEKLLTKELSAKVILDASGALKIPFGKPNTQKAMRFWLTSLTLSDKASTEVQFKSLKADTKFTESLLGHFSALLETFLATEEMPVPPQEIERFFNDYESELF